MNTAKLSSWLTLLANLGVLVGIFFLAIELRQNNELMEAEARFNRVSVSKEAYNIQSTNGELAEIVVKVRNDEPLTEVELYRYTSMIMRFLVNMEWMFRELPADSSERKYTEDQMRRSLAFELNQQILSEHIDGFDPDFVDWVESTVNNN